MISKIVTTVMGLLFALGLMLLMIPAVGIIIGLLSKLFSQI